MRHREYKTSARLFIQQDFCADDTFSLNENQIHYLRNVLRLSSGVEIIVFNSKDGEWLATITRLDKRHGEIALKKELRPYKQTSDVWVAFVPIKKTRLDFMLEKVTELGASKIIPIRTEYCQNTRLKYDRMQAQVIEASEQCERLDIPDILEMQLLKQFLDNFPKNRKLIVCAEKGETTPIKQIVSELKETPIVILVGAEGGFSDAEIELIKSYDFVEMVDLGEHILRAETAMIAALSCYQLF